MLLRIAGVVNTIVFQLTVLELHLIFPNHFMCQFSVLGLWKHVRCKNDLENAGCLRVRIRKII